MKGLWKYVMQRKGNKTGMNVNLIKATKKWGKQHIAATNTMRAMVDVRSNNYA